jgi:hypothetical protein
MSMQIQQTREIANLTPFPETDKKDTCNHLSTPKNTAATRNMTQHKSPLPQHFLLQYIRMRNQTPRLGRDESHHTSNYHLLVRFRNHITAFRVSFQLPGEVAARGGSDSGRVSGVVSGPFFVCGLGFRGVG